MEVYITSFGILTIAGLASLIFGSLFLFRTDNSFIDLESSLVYSVVAAIGAYVVFLAFFIVKTHIKNKNYFSQETEEGIISKILDGNKYQLKAKSLDAQEALSKKVIDKIINDQDQLIELLNGRNLSVLGNKIVLNVNENVPTQTISMDPGQQILNIFSNPGTAYVLFIIGAALIYF
jgi:membrane-bound ClpP family serine protease